MNNEAKQKLLNAKTDLDTDMQLDVTEAEDLMEEFFKKFDVDRGNFNINTYYPDEPFSWNPFKKKPGGDGSRFHYWNAYRIRKSGQMVIRLKRKEQ